MSRKNSSISSDTIKRILVIVVLGLFLGYLWFLFVEGKMIVKNEFVTYNLFLTIVLSILGIYITIFYGIYPIKIKFSRATLFVLGLAIILMSQNVLANDPINGIYIGDIASVLGVIILVTGPTNLLVSKKVQKQIKDRDIEIIEI